MAQPQIQETIRFDKTQSYGLIYGNPGLAFEQNGYHFGSDEKAVEKWSTPEQIAQERIQAHNRIRREQEMAQARARQERLRRLAEE